MFGLSGPIFIGGFRGLTVDSSGDIAIDSCVVSEAEVSLEVSWVFSTGPERIE